MSFALHLCLFAAPKAVSWFAFNSKEMKSLR